MGSLGGHLLPGSFFIIFGIWWSFVTAIRFLQSKIKSPFKKNSLVGYMSTATMPCICLPCGSLRRAPFESYLKLFFTFVGVLIEFIFGWEYVPKNGGASHHEHNHAGAVGASNMSSMNAMNHGTEELVYAFDFKNGQHITMYSAFLLGAIVEIIIHYRFDVPKRLEYIFGAVAFALEGFLFANHLHSREPLDVHIHSLLLYAIEGCVIFTCLEFIKPTEIMFTYGRIMCTILQGTWFYQIGFVLYPPTKSPSWHWDLNDHNQIMIITMSFCWHIMLIMTGLLIQLWLIKRVYASSKTLRNRWDELLISDEKTVVISNGSRSRETTKFLSLNSEDEDSDNNNNENVTFDTMKLLKNNKINSSNTTSGLSSANSSRDKSPV